MTTDTTKTDVLIAGGSYAGLALAAALSHETGGQLRVTVAAPAFPKLDASSSATDPRASALSRGSINLLAALGIWPALAEHAQPVSAIHLTDSALADIYRPTVMSYDLAADASHLSDRRAMVILENRYLGAALHDAVSKLDGITLVPDSAVTGFAVAGQTIRATLANRPDIGAALLVAADGNRSHLRDAAGIKTLAWSYHQHGIIVTVTPERPHDGIAVQHFLPAGPFALLPLTGNRVCITWSEQSAEAERLLALDPDQFRIELEHRFGHHLGTLTTISKPRSWPLQLRVARQLIAPRLALVGDAAHTLHPIAGQGLNLGLRDVAALTETIVDAARLGLDIGHTTVLERYERWRRFDNLASGAAFDTFNRLFSSESTMLRSARIAALKLVDRLPGLKSQLILEARGDTAASPRLLQDAESALG